MIWATLVLSILIGWSTYQLYGDWLSLGPTWLTYSLVYCFVFPGPIIYIAIYITWGPKSMIDDSEALDRNHDETPHIQEYDPTYRLNEASSIPEEEIECIDHKNEQVDHLAPAHPIHPSTESELESELEDTSFQEAEEEIERRSEATPYLDEPDPTSHPHRKNRQSDILKNLRAQDVDEEELISGTLHFMNEEETEDYDASTRKPAQETSREIHQPIEARRQPHFQFTKHGVTDKLSVLGQSQLPVRGRLRPLSKSDITNLADESYISRQLARVASNDYAQRCRLSRYLYLDLPLPVVEYVLLNKVHGNRVNSLLRAYRNFNISSDLMLLACSLDSISSKEIEIYHNERWPLELIKKCEVDRSFRKSNARVVLSWPKRIQRLFLTNVISYDDCVELKTHDFQVYQGISIDIVVSILGVATHIDHRTEHQVYHWDSPVLSLQVQMGRVTQVISGSSLLNSALDDGVSNA